VLIFLRYRRQNSKYIVLREEYENKLIEQFTKKGVAKRTALSSTTSPIERKSKIENQEKEEDSKDE